MLGGFPGGTYIRTPVKRGEFRRANPRKRAIDITDVSEPDNFCTLPTDIEQNIASAADRHVLIPLPHDKGAMH